MSMKLRVTVVIAVAACLLSVILLSAFDGGENEVWRAEVSWAEFFETMEELCAEADLIAVGTVQEIEGVTEITTGQAPWGPVGYYLTDFVFSVEQVLKGPGNATEATICQTGASGQWEIRNDPLLRVGDEYVVFLGELKGGGYNILGGPQGRFRIIGDEVFSMIYILRPELLDVDLGDWESVYRFYLDVKGIEKEAFVDWVMASLPLCGVDGYVGDSYTGYPLQYAEVRVNPAGPVAYTNSAGYYEIVLPPGTYSLTASYLTFYNQTYTVQVVQYEFTRQNFMLEPMYPGYPIPLGDPDGLQEVSAALSQA